MRSIILCGLPGCGKTTVGLQLSEKTGVAFMDVDILIEQQYKEKRGTALTCRQIFIQEGASVFRTFERDVIATLAYNHRENKIMAFEAHQTAVARIISIGGGAMENQENIKNLKSIGTIVYLKIDLKELFFQRMRQKGLPAFLDSNDPLGSFEKLAEKRKPIFEEFSDMKIDGDFLAPDEIAAAIILEMAITNSGL